MISIRLLNYRQVCIVGSHGGGGEGGGRSGVKTGKKCPTTALTPRPNPT